MVSSELISARVLFTRCSPPPPLPPLCVSELRTPLHGILAMAREMMDFQLDDAIRECGQIIAHCGDHMHSLINDILDFEKIESDQLRLEAKPFSVPDVVNHLIKVHA
jgi:signal transduction histidine kinase